MLLNSTSPSSTSLPTSAGSCSKTYLTVLVPSKLGPDCLNYPLFKFYQVSIQKTSLTFNLRSFCKFHQLANYSLALARALHLPVATFWGFAYQGGEVRHMCTGIFLESHSGEKCLVPRRGGETVYWNSLGNRKIKSICLPRLCVCTGLHQIRRLLTLLSHQSWQASKEQAKSLIDAIDGFRDR